MTYMGKPYYPVWLDNLADDVTLEAAAMDGTAHGAEDVRSIVVTARPSASNNSWVLYRPLPTVQHRAELYCGGTYYGHRSRSFGAIGLALVLHRPRT